LRKQAKLLEKIKMENKKAAPKPRKSRIFDVMAYIKQFKEAQEKDELLLRQQTDLLEQKFL
jgi:hypothetical protein